MIVVEKKLPKNPDTAILERFPAAAGEGVIGGVQERAREQFLRYGIPGNKDERYKYTDIQKILERKYQPVLAPEHHDFRIEEIFRCDIPTLNTWVFTVLNGFYFEKQDHLQELPGGVLAGGLRQALRERPDLVEAYLDRYAGESTDGLAALNRAFASDGFFLYVPDNTVMEKPVQVINLIRGDQDVMVQPRSLVILGKNAQGGVLICDHALTENRVLSNAVKEFYVGENSSLDITRLQNEHNTMTDISHYFVHQEHSSRVTTNMISLHGGMIRNNLDVRLNGEGAENHALGLFLTDRVQHMDHSLFIDHAAPHCLSNQVYKGVLDDEATGAFEGKILVRPDAQKTEAYQVNKNILLSDSARMNTKPQLEIYADDVKCTHGATVGQLDEEALFYLRSRGIPEYEARMVMMYAFAHEVIREIHIEPLRDRIRELVDRRLRGELPRCHTCLVDYEK
jgi:Fe-S cluster assembly protein SufD